VLNHRSPLFEQCCDFTGRAQKYTRKDAMQVLVDDGGIREKGVTKKTHYLILYTEVKDGKGNKWPKLKNTWETDRRLKLFQNAFSMRCFPPIPMDKSEWMSGFCDVNRHMRISSLVPCTLRGTILSMANKKSATFCIS